MQINLETTEGLGRRLLIQVPAETVDSQVNKKVNEIAKTAVLDGFRPGKVPVTLVRSRFGSKIRHDAVADVVRDTLTEAFKKEDLRVAGYPNIHIKTSEPGKPLEYEATFEVFPKVDLNELHDVEVEQYTVSLKDSDTEDMLGRLRKQYVDWIEVDRPAQSEDRVEIDCDGKIDGVAFEGAKGSNMPLVLGSKTMIPGFEEKIIGAKAGDHLVFTVTFPADYFKATVAGKDATFEVSVNKVLEQRYPIVDDEFAKKLGVEEGGLESLRSNLHKNMERERGNALQHANKSRVLDKLLEVNTVMLPQALIRSEIETLRRQAVQRFQNFGHSAKIPEFPNEMFQKAAERRVSLGLLMGEVVKKHQLKASPEKVRALIEEMASAYDRPEEVIAWYYADPERLSQYELVALEDDVVVKLLEGAKVSEKAISYDELMKMNR